MSSKSVWIPLPDHDFDTTEVAVPWKLLTEAGVQVSFATEQGGQAPACDPVLLTGVIFGKLGARPEPKRFYAEMARSPEFRKPLSWDSVEPGRYDGLILPGGHAPGMRQYLASESLQRKVVEFWNLGRPVGAICHGVLVLARARDPRTNQSPIYEKRTTCLPGYMERLAFYVTAWRRGRYYRTYPLYVEEEVRQALRDPERQFVRGPLNLGRPGTLQDSKAAFVVQDGHYLSSRFPGDAYLFAQRFLEMLAKR